MHTLISRIVTVAVLFTLAGCGNLHVSSESQSQAASKSDTAVLSPAATAQYQRALMYMEAGDDERAVQELEVFSAAYPGYAGPQINLAIIHGRNDRDAAAAAALEQAIELCSGCAPAYNEQGILWRRQGRFQEAEAAYLNAIDSDPDYALAYINLGVLYDLYLQQPELALDYYQQYALLDSDIPDDVEVDKWIADLKRRNGQAQRAARAEVSQ